jgi:hypothetical protein
VNFITLLLILNWFFQTATAAPPTLDDIYSKTYQVAAEIQLLKNHYNIKEEINVPDVSIEMAPKYNWQKSYEVMYKINVLRDKLELSLVGVPSREPQLELPLQTRYEQMIRILTELQILKEFLDISETVAVPAFKNKTPTDVYNTLNRVAFELDLINGKTLTPSDTLSQAMRISEDVNAILDALNVKNSSIPPQKAVDVQPGHVFDTALLLLEEIKRLQKIAGINGIDFYQLKPVNRTITASDVFSIFGIVLAELQQIKAYLGLKYVLTPMAEHYENVRSTDVQQIIGWNIRKLQAIHSLKR